MSSTTAPQPSASENPLTAYIFKLPVEILKMIFEYLDIYDHVTLSNNGAQKLISQFTVLRSVSRQFRILACEALLDYDSCDISALLAHREAPRLHTKESRVRQVQETQFFKLLFEDEYFVHYLNQYTEWKFSSIEGLFAILTNIPLFHQNARCISLEIPHGLHIAIDRLALCSGLNNLAVRLNDEPHIPEFIRETFPHLENLEIYDVRHDLNLKRYTGLQNLYLHFPSDRNQPRTLLREHLPLDSSQTLTNLLLDNAKSLEDCTLASYRLHEFINLKHIGIINLNDNLCRLLVAADLKLTNFSARLEDNVPCPRMMTHLLSSPSFENLRDCFLEIIPSPRSVRERYMRYCKQLFDAIKTHLRSLENLDLVTGVAASWIFSFKNMTNLKSMNLQVWEGMCYIDPRFRLRAAHE